MFEEYLAIIDISKVEGLNVQLLRLIVYRLGKPAVS